MTGSIGHRVASHDDMEQLSNDQWIGLLKLVVELVCFDINKAKSFEKASGKLKQCKLSNFKKPSEAIAHFTSLYTNARNIHGKEYMTAYERFTLLTTKLPAEVEIEIQEYLATHKGINILEMEWSDADDIINDAWGIYERRPEYNKYRISQLDDTEKQERQKLSAHPSQMEQGTVSKHFNCLVQVTPMALYIVTFACRLTP